MGRPGETWMGRGARLWGLGLPVLLGSVGAFVQSPSPFATLASEKPAAGKFLVASASLRDPNFAETVVLLLYYDPDGALGVIVNRRTDVPLSLVLPDMEELSERPDTVHLGGPVTPDRFLMVVRSDREPEESRAVIDDLYYSQSKELLRRLAKRANKKQRSSTFRVFAGHSGWGPGQLDREIARGDWHIVPADADTVFEDNPSGLWERLLPPDAHPEDRLRARTDDEMGTRCVSEG